MVVCPSVCRLTCLLAYAATSLRKRKDGWTRQRCRQQAKGAVVEMDQPLFFCGPLAVAVDTSMFETGNRQEAEEAVGEKRGSRRVGGGRPERKRGESVPVTGRRNKSETPDVMGRGIVCVGLLGLCPLCEEEDVFGSFD